MNQRITGYSVRIRAVRFQPMGFSLDLLDMTVAQDRYPDPPVLRVPRLRASVDWGALLDRRLVADFLVQHPTAYVNLTQARAELRDKTALRARGWQEALEAIYPLKINVFRVQEGEVTYVDRGPFRTLRLSHVHLHADNIRNVRSPDHVYPSPIHLEAIVFDSGKVALDGNANFLSWGRCGDNLLATPMKGYRVLTHEARGRYLTMVSPGGFSPNIYPWTRCCISG